MKINLANFIIPKTTSRDTALKSELEFPGSTLQITKNKPRCRTNFTSIVADCNLYIFGGISDKSLNDMWILDLRILD